MLAGLAMMPRFIAQLDFSRIIPEEMYNRFQKAIELIIETGIKNKEFKRVDPKTAALALILNIEGIFWFTLYKSKAGDASVYMDTISDYILKLYKA